MGKAFSGYDWRHGFIAELDRKFPSSLFSWLSEISGPLNVYPGDDDTAYLYAVQDSVIERERGKRHELPAGHVASVPGNFRLVRGQGMFVIREGYRGVFAIAEVEEQGRLRYIDGCTDSLVLAPMRMGDPCVNLLYFPPGISQTMHTHPSDRIGIVMSGRGWCAHVENGHVEMTPLCPGMLFCIHTNGAHRFITEDSPMRVLAYHPDSDFGPQDENHPMINRTIVGGVSAAQLRGIHTK